MPEQSTVAVIMVLYNRLSTECLESIEHCLRTTKIPARFIVVDNCSPSFYADEIISMLAPRSTVLLREGNYGFGHSNNFGARYAAADYYFFLNPDTVLHDPEIINKLYDYLSRNPKAGLAAPKLLYPDGSLQETCRRFPAWHMFLIQRTSLKNTGFGKRYLEHFLMRDFDHSTEKEVDWVCGSAMFVRGDVWRKIGGFDERYFMYFEDVDVCRRIRQEGYKVMYNPDVSLIHAHARESATEQNPVAELFRNKIARHHVASYLKYFLKWNFIIPFRALLKNNH